MTGLPAQARSGFATAFGYQPAACGRRPAG